MTLADSQLRANAYIQDDLESKVVYELILSHGRTDLYLFYANLEEDHSKIVEHWITEEQWLRAIDVLNRQVSFGLRTRGSLSSVAGVARIVLPLRFNPDETRT